MTKITAKLTIAALAARLERLESERAADAKVVGDAKRHVGALCRQARRILADNKQLRQTLRTLYDSQQMASKPGFLATAFSRVRTAEMAADGNFYWMGKANDYMSEPLKISALPTYDGVIKVAPSGRFETDPTFPKYPIGAAVHLNRWAEPGPRAAENAGWVVEGVFGNGSYLLKHIDGGTTNASDSDIAYQVMAGVAITDTPPWAKYTGFCKVCGTAWGGDSPTCPGCGT